jgi:hypothetical protein
LPSAILRFFLLVLCSACQLTSFLLRCTPSSNCFVFRNREKSRAGEGFGQVVRRLGVARRRRSGLKGQAREVRPSNWQSARACSQRIQPGRDVRTGSRRQGWERNLLTAGEEIARRIHSNRCCLKLDDIVDITYLSFSSC